MSNIYEEPSSCAALARKYAIPMDQSTNYDTPITDAGYVSVSNQSPTSDICSNHLGTFSGKRDLTKPKPTVRPDTPPPPDSHYAQVDVSEITADFAPPLPILTDYVQPDAADMGYGSDSYNMAASNSDYYSVPMKSRVNPLYGVTP